MADHDLITRLIRFRTAVKRRLVAYGICAVGAGGTIVGGTASDTIRDLFHAIIHAITGGG